MKNNLASLNLSFCCIFPIIAVLSIILNHKQKQRPASLSGCPVSDIKVKSVRDSYKFQ